MPETSRRTFFLAAGAAAAASSVHAVSASDTLNVAVIGLGLRGVFHLMKWGNALGTRITSVCDVYKPTLERGMKMVADFHGARPRGYSDMRHIFDDKSVDVVVLSLASHWHSLATIWACQAGKDVYVEKPASHNPYEGRKAVEAARKYDRIVQVGSQGRSMPHKIQAMDLLHKGVIGKVYLAKGLCYKYRPSIGHKPDGPVPAGLDWDMFLGPAPMRPYNESRFHYNWNFFWDTGRGDIGTQGPHELDIARWGLGKVMPQSVVSTGGKYVYKDDQETPNTQIATYDYGDSEIVFEVRNMCTGTEGGLGAKRASTIAAEEDRKLLEQLVLPHVDATKKSFGTGVGRSTMGNLFYGNEGWMAMDNSGFQVYRGPDSEQIMDVSWDGNGTKSDGLNAEPHIRNFLAAVRSRDRKKLNADIETGVTSANLIHLANASYRVKRLLQYDEAGRCFVNDSEADTYLTRKYRAPYVVPEQV
jgi:predicted dehydrogenase